MNPDLADLEGWIARIERAVGESDPVVRNLMITEMHRALGLALAEAIEPGYQGANFHTWAVWGSKKAGVTIRGEDARFVPPGLAGVGALSGGMLRGRRGAVLGGLLAGAVGKAAVVRSSRIVAQGNILVLDDIGRLTAAYLHAVATGGDVPALLAALPPGPPSAGGKDFLKQAFTAYDAARLADDPDVRDERVLLGNVLAFSHEQRRLEPLIDSAIPRGARRVVTGRMLAVQFGHHKFEVSHDIRAVDAEYVVQAFDTIDTPELSAFLKQWDTAPDSLTGSAAHDWSKLAQRMCFVCELFKEYHLDPDLHSPPYDEQTLALIEQGVRPPGPL